MPESHDCELWDQGSLGAGSAFPTVTQHSGIIGVLF